MGLSKDHLGMNAESVIFSPESLAAALKNAFPQISFAYLLGSGQNGQVRPLGDLDIAVYLSMALDPVAPSFSLYGAVQDLVEATVGQVRCDLGILNRAEPVYRYEALAGRVLFVRDKETWLRFYSLTCREYEHQLFHYEKQRRYRLEVRR